MISRFIAASIIATTAFSPVSSAEPGSPAELSSTYKTVELVRENATSWWTISVNQTCPSDFPYVHQVGWGWTNEPHDNITFGSVSYGNTPSQPATRIAGLMTNWNLETRWVEANLGCTSDVNQAMIVPPHQSEPRDPAGR